MRAVMTVTGKDIIGILAEVSGKCSELNVNITEVTQSVLQDLFCMIMLVDTEKCSVPLSEFSDIMATWNITARLASRKMNTGHRCITSDLRT